MTAYLDMVGTCIGGRIHKVLRMIHSEVLVGLRKTRDILIGSPHVAEEKWKYIANDEFFS